MIANIYTPDELRAKIASHEYGAELCLQHAMLNIAMLESKSQHWKGRDMSKTIEHRFVGCDDLREWLETQGFRAYTDHLGRESNLCNWCACKRSSLPARECECNEGKPIQLLVKPHRINIPGGPHESVEVDVTGELGGIWFTLKAYSLRPDELRERLPQIEAQLIAAWNALLARPA